MTNNPRLTFQISVWRPWLLAIAPLALLAVLGIAFVLTAGSIGIATGILLGFMAIALLLLLPIGLAVRRSRWHVDPSGLGGPNNQLVYHWLDWSEIESVTPWPIPGYRYVQVNGVGKRRAFWVPLFFTDRTGFRAAIAQYAPPGNPLRDYLEQHQA